MGNELSLEGSLDFLAAPAIGAPDSMAFATDVQLAAMSGFDPYPPMVRVFRAAARWLGTTEVRVKKPTVYQIQTHRELAVAVLNLRQVPAPARMTHSYFLRHKGAFARGMERLGGAARDELVEGEREALREAVLGLRAYSPPEMALRVQEHFSHIFGEVGMLFMVKMDVYEALMAAFAPLARARDAVFASPTPAAVAAYLRLCDQLLGEARLLRFDADGALHAAAVVAEAEVVSSSLHSFLLLLEVE